MCVRLFIVAAFLGLLGPLQAGSKTKGPASDSGAGEKKKQDKAKDRIKEIAGTAEFLNQLPKKFARLVAVDPATGRVTLHPEGEAKESTWTLVPDGEIKVHGFWGRLEDLQKGDRVWAWFHIDRKGKPSALAMLADEMSQQDLNGTPWEVLGVDGKRLQLKGKLGKTRELIHAGSEAPAKGSRLYIQSAGDSVRLAWSEKDLEKHRLAQKKRQEERWQADGLPGSAGFVHIFSGEMDALLDHQGMRWGRSLTAGDKVSLQPLDSAGKPSAAAIAGVVKAIAPFRDRTQVRLVVKNRELSDLAPGQRLLLKMPPPADQADSLLPPDLDRAHGDKQERIEWFLASIYCTCGVKGDRCTGHFYTLSSCNPNACGMPNQMRRTLGKLIDAGLTDRQILEELLRQKGPSLLRPHLLP